MFTLGDVADILDSALDTGISIVDALSKLSDIADDGGLAGAKGIKFGEVKEYDHKKIDENGNLLKRGSRSCNEGIPSVSSTVLSDDSGVYSGTSVNFNARCTPDSSIYSDPSLTIPLSPDCNNDDVGILINPGSNSVLEGGNMGCNEMQKKSVIEAFGNLCHIADDVLNYQKGDTVVRDSNRDKLNDKVNDMLDSFQKLDQTVEKLKLQAMQKHLAIHPEDQIVLKSHRLVSDNIKDSLKTNPNLQVRSDKVNYQPKSNDELKYQHQNLYHTCVAEGLMNQDAVRRDRAGLLPSFKSSDCKGYTVKHLNVSKCHSFPSYRPSCITSRDGQPSSAPNTPVELRNHNCTRNLPLSYFDSHEHSSLSSNSYFHEEQISLQRQESQETYVFDSGGEENQGKNISSSQRDTYTLVNSNNGNIVVSSQSSALNIPYPESINRDVSTKVPTCYTEMDGVKLRNSSSNNRNNAHRQTYILNNDLAMETQPDINTKVAHRILQPAATPPKTFGTMPKNGRRVPIPEVTASPSKDPVLLRTKTNNVTDRPPTYVLNSSIQSQLPDKSSSVSNRVDPVTIQNENPQLILQSNGHSLEIPIESKNDYSNACGTYPKSHARATYVIDGCEAQETNMESSSCTNTFLQKSQIGKYNANLDRTKIEISASAKKKLNMIDKYNIPPCVTADENRGTYVLADKGKKKNVIGAQNRQSEINKLKTNFMKNRKSDDSPGEVMFYITKPTQPKSDCALQVIQTGIDNVTNDEHADDLIYNEKEGQNSIPEMHDDSLNNSQYELLYEVNHDQGEMCDIFDERKAVHNNIDLCSSEIEGKLCYELMYEIPVVKTIKEKSDNQINDLQDRSQHLKLVCGDANETFSCSNNKLELLPQMETDNRERSSESMPNEPISGAGSSGAMLSTDISYLRSASDPSSDSPQFQCMDNNPKQDLFHKLGTLQSLMSSSLTKLDSLNYWHGQHTDSFLGSSDGTQTDRDTFISDKRSRKLSSQCDESIDDDTNDIDDDGKSSSPSSGDDSHFDISTSTASSEDDIPCTYTVYLKRPGSDHLVSDKEWLQKGQTSELISSCHTAQSLPIPETISEVADNLDPSYINKCNAEPSFSISSTSSTVVSNNDRPDDSSSKACVPPNSIAFTIPAFLQEKCSASGSNESNKDGPCLCNTSVKPKKSVSSDGPHKYARNVPRKVKNTKPNASPRTKYPIHTGFPRQKNSKSNDDKDPDDEVLALQLAALRTELEEKRNRFNREKRQQQNEWKARMKSSGLFIDLDQGCEEEEVEREAPHTGSPGRFSKQHPGAPDNRKQATLGVKSQQVAAVLERIEQQNKEVLEKLNTEDREQLTTEVDDADADNIDNVNYNNNDDVNTNFNNNMVHNIHMYESNNSSGYNKNGDKNSKMSCNDDSINSINTVSNVSSSSDSVKKGKHLRDNNICDTNDIRYNKMDMKPLQVEELVDEGYPKLTAESLNIKKSSLRLQDIDNSQYALPEQLQDENIDYDFVPLVFSTPESYKDSFPLIVTDEEVGEKAEEEEKLSQPCSTPGSDCTFILTECSGVDPVLSPQVELNLLQEMKPTCEQEITIDDTLEQVSSSLMDLLQYVESLSLNDQLQSTETSLTKESPTNDAQLSLPSASPMTSLAFEIVSDVNNDEKPPLIISAAIENERKTPTSFSVGFDELEECPELTPQQKKKRERFLRQRQKSIAEDRERKVRDEETEKKPHEQNMLQDEQEQHQQLRKIKRDSMSAIRPSLTPPLRATTPTSTRHRKSPDESSRPTPDSAKRGVGKSNRKLIQNSMNHCCLCGGVNKDARTKCFEAMDKSNANHFLVLFRDDGLKFRSVYEYYPETETVLRIYGIGPKTVTEKMISKYFKYDSSGKEFTTLATKHLSIQVDGFTIRKELWEKKQTNSQSTTINNSTRSDSHQRKPLGHNTKRQAYA